MFIILPIGFYSITLARSSSAAGASFDPEHVQIRARLRTHLAELQGAFPDLLGRMPILYTPTGDYHFRITPVKKATFATLLAEVAMTMATTNVKNDVARHQASKGGAGAAFEDAVVATWHAMHALERFEGAGSQRT